ncbi:uncharacterized protein LOC112043059 [Bicyclus anynana]|uniref:Uncharacterized protein LOC112043059 n=1 Tax=Bicyclus anynana TaxID=110368 RepID=A0ABM3LPU1_BICAN|nr:uncharacterized protein LOC112043059 [Bicyclus anynana]
MKAVTCFLFVLLQIAFIYGSLQHKCWITDSPCLTARAKAIVPAFAAGVPELGIEPLDIMVFDGLNINEKRFKHIWNTTYVHGLGKSIIDELSVNLNTKLIRLVFRSDMLLQSHYIQEGHLLSTPVEGAGKLRMEFDNVRMEMVMPFDILKDFFGRDIIDLKDFRYGFEMQGARLYFGNLFYGNNELSRKTHMAINKNWKQLTTIYGPYVFDKTNDKIFNAIRTYLHYLPLETVCFYQIFVSSLVFRTRSFGEKMKTFYLRFTIIQFLHLLAFVPFSQSHITKSQTRVKCSLNDSVCLTKEAQKTLQEFAEGIPALGIKKVGKIHLDPIRVKLPNFKYNWTEVTVAGLENAIFDHISFDMELNVFRILIHSDIVIEFNNDVIGTVLFMYVYGGGPSKITLKNMQIEILFKFDIINENGKDYMDITSYFHALDLVDGAHYQFSNINDGDKRFNDKLHRTLNENWRIVVANFGGYVNKKLVDKMYDTVKIYMRSTPLKDLALY